MHLTHDILKCHHSWHFKTCIMKTAMINTYVPQR